MRSLAKPGSHAPTEKQLAQRLKFGLAVKFVQSMNSLFQTGFRNSGDEMTAVNSAFLYAGQCHQRQLSKLWYLLQPGAGKPGQLTKCIGAWGNSFCRQQYHF